jgi:hypothetical protein
MQQGSFQSPKDNDTQTQANSGTFRHPQAYNTQTRMNTGQFQQSNFGELYPYTQMPPPPPPPVNKRKTFQMLIGIIVAIGLIVCGAIVGAVASRQYLQTPGQTQTAFHPTPTQDIKIALLSSDFPTFLKAFATAMASKDYADIRQVTDTQNFQYIPLNAEGFLSWNETYNELITGNISPVLQYPPITPSQESYCNYTQSGYTGLLTINSTNVEYDIGTLSGNAVAGTTQTNTNGTVFAFESAPVGGIWLWRAMVSNNSPC